MTPSFPSVAELCPNPSALGLSLDVKGWHSDAPIFKKLINDSEAAPATIIEVGSWLGASTIHMAELLKRRPGATIPWRIYCADTWLGGADHFVNQDKPENNLRLDNFGYPGLYHQFLYNITEKLGPYAEHIYPIAQPSVSAARILGRAGVTADLIYIDGSHVYEDVYADLLGFGLLLKPSAIMFGDDWTDFPGVRLAVTRFAYENGFKLAVDGDSWQLMRPAA